LWSSITGWTGRPFLSHEWPVQQPEFQLSTAVLRFAARDAVGREAAVGQTVPALSVGGVQVTAERTVGRKLFHPCVCGSRISQTHVDLIRRIWQKTAPPEDFSSSFTSPHSGSRFPPVQVMHFFRSKSRVPDAWWLWKFPCCDTLNALLSKDAQPCRQ